MKTNISDVLDNLTKETKMSENDKTTIQFSGTSFKGLLFLVFLTLKLTNVINWSWWWITAPLWIPSAIIIGIGLLVVAILALTSIIEKKKN